MKRLILTACVISGIFSSSQLRAADKTAFQFSVFEPAQIFSARKDVIGVRMGLLYGRNRDMHGFDFGLGINDVDGELAGIQFAGVANRAADGRGLQMALGWNAVEAQGTAGLAGIQFAGMANRADSLHGVQIGTIYNSADTAEGFQFGLVNRTGKTSGMQLGLVNLADSATGVQLGMVNYARTMKGVQIGLANIATEGSIKFLPAIFVHF